MENYKTGENYAYLGLPANFLIFDEYVAFMEMLGTKENTAVLNKLKQIVMLGRQAGFFLILACQRPDAKYLGDGIRDQFNFRVALGRMSEMGYGMMFGSDVQKDFFLKQIKGRGYVDVGTSVISKFYTPLVPKGHDFLEEIKSLSNSKQDTQATCEAEVAGIEGAGGSVIGQELENLGYLTKYGNSTWVPTTVLGIIKNEKYKGDILLGKTFTVDPISKRRLENLGEEDQFYIRNHHEPIISEEVFDKAQEILNRRSKNRGKIGDGNSKREKYSRKYAFSCLLECGFCGGTLTRRRWHSGTEYNKVIWQCVTSTKKGKKHCPHSKGIPETAIEEAFIESYRLLCDNNKDVLEEFLNRIDETLSSSSVNKKLLKVDKEIEAIEKKKSKLVDMRLEDTIDSDTYESKFSSMTSKQEDLLKERLQLQETARNEKDIKRRLRDFKKTLEQNEVLNEFDRYVF